MRTLTALCLGLIYLSPAFATENLCNRIIGSWYGTFTLKDPKDCHIYHNCQVGVKASVTRIDATHFSAVVTPRIGGPETHSLQCENNLLSTDRKDSRIKLSCPDNIICRIEYDDPKLSSVMLGSGIDESHPRIGLYRQRT